MEILATLRKRRPLPTQQASSPAEQEAERERALNEVLFTLESRGEQGIVAAFGKPFYLPEDMRILETLEHRGWARQEVLTCITMDAGMRRRGTYFITDAGRLHCTALRQSQLADAKNQ